jgi:hypothetical protein
MREMSTQVIYENKDKSNLNIAFSDAGGKANEKC